MLVAAGLYLDPVCFFKLELPDLVKLGLALTWGAKWPHLPGRLLFLLLLALWLLAGAFDVSVVDVQGFDLGTGNHPFALFFWFCLLQCLHSLTFCQQRQHSAAARFLLVTPWLVCIGVSMRGEHFDPRPVFPVQLLYVLQLGTLVFVGARPVDSKAPGQAPLESLALPIESTPKPIRVIRRKLTQVEFALDFPELIADDQTLHGIDLRSQGAPVESSQFRLDGKSITSPFTVPWQWRDAEVIVEADYRLANGQTGQIRRSLKLRGANPRFEVQARPAILNADGKQRCRLLPRVYLFGRTHPEPDQNLSVDECEQTLGEFLPGRRSLWQTPLLLQAEGFEERLRLRTRVGWDRMPDQPGFATCDLLLRGCQLWAQVQPQAFLPEPDQRLTLQAELRDGDGKKVDGAVTIVQLQDTTQGPLSCGRCQSPSPCNCASRALKVPPVEGESVELSPGPEVLWNVREGCEPVRGGTITWTLQAQDPFGGLWTRKVQALILLGHLEVQTEPGFLSLQCQPDPPSQVEVDWIFLRAGEPLEAAGRMQTSGSWETARRLEISQMREAWRELPRPLQLGLRVELKAAGQLWGNSELFCFQLAPS